MTDTIDVSDWRWQLFDRADPAQAMLRTPAVLVLNDSEQARLRELEARFYRLFPSVTQGTALMLFRLSDAPTATARSLRLPFGHVLFPGPPPEEIAHVV